MTTVLDTENLISFLKILIETDPEFIYQLMEEIKVGLEAMRAKRFEDTLNKVFTEYHDVFKALA